MMMSQGDRSERTEAARTWLEAIGREPFPERPTREWFDGVKLKAETARRLLDHPRGAVNPSEHTLRGLLEQAVSLIAQPTIQPHARERWMTDVDAALGDSASQPSPTQGAVVEALRDLLRVTEAQDAEWDNPAETAERAAIHERARAALAEHSRGPV